MRAVVWGAILLAVLAQTSARGWGGPHCDITRAALATLPGWEKQLLRDEAVSLGNRYCLIPDEVHKDKANRKFAMMDSQPGAVYLVILHLPGTPTENYEVLRYFLDKAIGALRAGQMGDAARFAGTIAHVLEDWGCPAHSVPGDNMFTLFKQFLPPPPSYRYAPLHGPIENGRLDMDLGNYSPRLLGVSADEAAFHLLHRVQQATVNARAQVVPIIQGLYAGDSNAVAAAQLKAATLDAMVVADALHTILCLGAQTIEPRAAESLRTVDLSAQNPLEAVNLFMPQTAFFSKPYWGHPTTGVIGTNGVPLRLNVTEHGHVVTKQFADGIGTGTRSVLTYLVPEGVYSRFTAQVGLHAELGTHGCVLFEVMGNGRSLVKLGPIRGDKPAATVDVALAGVTNLQLITSSAGGDGSGNYAIWAEPRLVKDTHNTP